MRLVIIVGRVSQGMVTISANKVLSKSSFVSNYGGVVSGIELVHINGSLTCKTSSFWTHWGCTRTTGEFIGIYMINNTNQIVSTCVVL